MDVGSFIAGVFSILWWFSFGWFLAYVVLGSWLEVQLVHLKIDKRLALSKRFGPVFVFHFLFSVALINPYSLLWVGDKLDDIFSTTAGNLILALLYLMILPIVLECLFLRIISQWKWLRWFQWRPPLKRVILASLLINLVSFGTGYGVVFVRDVTPKIMRADLFRKQGAVEGKDVVGAAGGLESKDVIEATKQGDLTKLKSILAKNPALANARQGKSYTALHYAAIGGHKEAAELLLAKGADVNAKNKSGRTCLHLAAEKSYKEVAEVLIARGAKVNAQDNEGWVPLHWAVAKNEKDIVKLLVSNGANVDASNKEGYTPLHTVAENGHTEIAEFLIVKGANVNAKARDGSTALHWSARAGHKDMANLLIAQGANVNAKDNNGFTPLHWALERGHKDVAELLRKHGAVE